MHRRGALLGLAGGFIAACTNTRPRFPDNPFSLGVASGDPAHDSVALWTRLATDPLAEDGRGGMPPEAIAVDWEIAEDEAMSRVVTRGTVSADPAFAHSVHVEARGLSPGRWYWYRFFTGAGANRVASPIGRTRTAPAPGSLEEVRFAVACCQLYDMGHYTAYQRMAEEDLHLVLHVGDYIYEGTSSGRDVRPHSLPACVRLEDYRRRYALYKLDAHLQRAHAQFPFAASFDDHEVAGNWAGESPESGGRDAFLQRRAAAFQAYYEHLPFRPAAPVSNKISLYRALAYGATAQILILDTRQFRTDQACGDGVKPTCAEREAPGATMLGQAQEQWLAGALTGSQARWNALAQQVMFAPYDHTAGPGETWEMDRWDGYPAARQRLLDFLAETKPANPVVLSGDSHSNWCFDIHRNPADESSPVIAPEFAVTSISSGGDGNDDHPASQPHLRFHNNRRGYLRIRATENTWQTDYRTVAYVTKPDAPITTAASFVLESGNPSAQRA